MVIIEVMYWVVLVMMMVIIALIKMITSGILMLIMLIRVMMVFTAKNCMWYIIHVYFITYDCGNNNDMVAYGESVVTVEIMVMLAVELGMVVM